jgi:hypothetical protein
VGALAGAGGAGVPGRLRREYGRGDGLVHTQASGRRDILTFPAAPLLISLAHSGVRSYIAVLHGHTKVVVQLAFSANPGYKYRQRFLAI